MSENEHIKMVAVSVFTPKGFQLAVLSQDQTERIECIVFEDEDLLQVVDHPDTTNRDPEFLLRFMDAHPHYRSLFVQFAQNTLPKGAVELAQFLSQLGKLIGQKNVLALLDSLDKDFVRRHQGVNPENN